MTHDPKAPWIVQKRLQNYVIKDSAGSVVAVVSFDRDDAASQERALANVCLLAVAPLMMNALKGTRDTLKQVPAGVWGAHETKIKRQIQRAESVIDMAAGGFGELGKK